MKTLTIFALFLFYSSCSGSYRTKTITIDVPSNDNSIPMNLEISQECARVLQLVSQTQLQYLENHQSRLQEDLTSNQQHKSFLTRVYEIPQKEGIVVEKPIKETVQSETLVKETEATTQGIISSIITKTGNVAGEIAKTAGQLAQDDVNIKAALIGGVLGGAGKAAANALHETGKVAADAAANIEEGVNNIFGHFDK